MTNILSVQDAALHGYMQYEKWRQKFEEEWAAPLIEMQSAVTAQKMIAMWEQLPDEMKAQMQRVNPQMYAEVERGIRELNDGQNKYVVSPAAVAGRDVGKGG